MYQSRVITGIAVLAVLLIWFGWFFLLLGTPAPPGTKPSETPFATWGVFGDSFGVIGSLMAKAQHGDYCYQNRGIAFDKVGKPGHRISPRGDRAGGNISQQ